MCVHNLRVISAFLYIFFRTITDIYTAAHPCKYQLHLLTFSEKMSCKQSLVL